MADPWNLKRALSFPALRDTIESCLAALYQSPGMGDGGVATPYLGAVSNLGRACDGLQSSGTSMAVTTRTAQSAISHPRILHHNWYSNSTDVTEKAPGGTCTYTDWIEYPIGQGYYGGTTVVAANGGYAVNDLGVQAVTIPKGALFKVWTFRSGAQVWTGGRGSWFLGAGYLASPSGADLLPQLNHVFYPGYAYVNTYWPTVLDTTSRRSILFIDDSHGMGQGERGEPDLEGFYGANERYFKDRCAWTNMSTNGLALTTFIGNHASRVAIGQYYSDIFIGLGGNDATSGRTSGQMLTDLDTVRGYYTGKGLLSSTEFPKTTSTDSGATTANQTPTTADTASREFSRAKMYGQRFNRVYDFAKGASFFRTDGKVVWKPGIWVDGTHTTADGYALAAGGEKQSPMFY